MMYELFSSRPWVAPVLVYIAATCLKILLVPAYHSTDFEVHRNWLALTHSLPVSKWYIEDTSEWTLDYPPLFAWFEWLLSWPAAFIDPAIVRVDNLNYSDSSCILFQRFSVMCSDLVLLYAVAKYCSFKWSQITNVNQVEREKQTLVVSLLILLNMGLLVVDHIHFQYNGFLYGILLLSITKMFQGKHFQAAAIYALLLNLKHLYIYIAPAYFVYLLKHQCFKPESSTCKNSGKNVRWAFSPVDFLKLGLIVTGVSAFSFAPFVYFGQMQQVLSRLFPFKRGLCHAYWAPNFWVLYNVADQAIAIVGTHLGVLSSSKGSMTSGLVGEMNHQVLPSIPPWLTMLLPLVAVMPAMLRLWMKDSTAMDFLKCLILSGYASFLFGWHVHEKAIMMMTVPLCLLVIEDSHYTKVHILLSTVAHVSLFPLLFKAAETLIKVCLFALYTVIALTSSLVTRYEGVDSGRMLWGGLTMLEMGYLFLCIAVQVYCLFMHGLFGFLSHLEFLPLLLTSLTCSVGVLWSWCLTYFMYLFH